jgi:hypothetical protein
MVFGANEPALEACREELQEVLEDWLLLGKSLKHELPVMDGFALKYTQVASEPI